MGRLDRPTQRKEKVWVGGLIPDQVWDADGEKRSRCHEA
jgi:hypothetical protein